MTKSTVAVLKIGISSLQQAFNSNKLYNFFPEF